jgi:hypothetical protein
MYRKGDWLSPLTSHEMLQQHPVHFKWVTHKLASQAIQQLDAQSVALPIL